MTATPSSRIEALERALAFSALGEPVGNLTLGRGRLDGKPVHVARVENRVASGSIGVQEASRLGAQLRVAAAERAPVVLYLDSAGAKVSEGLAALGSFRALFRSALESTFGGATLAAVLGRNCYGGSSMLAHLARLRLFAPETQLAMSGPSILAASAGLDPLDEMFRAMAGAAISASARVKAGEGNRLWSADLDLGAWLREALADAGDPVVQCRRRHETLRSRLPRGKAAAWESARRRDLERLYPGGYELKDASGLVAGHAQTEQGEETLLGIVGRSALGAERAWRFADEAWRAAEAPPRRLRVLLDCATHAARLEDERIVLSEFIVGMSAALHVLARRGTRIETTVVGEAGGGVYVALAAPASSVSFVHGARIRVLPGAAVAAILGESRESEPEAAQYRDAGVAEEELKLGIVPDSPA